MKKAEFALNVIKLPLDFFTVFFSFILSYAIRENFDYFLWIEFDKRDNLLEFNEFVNFSIFASFVFLFLATINGLYNIYFIKNKRKEFSKILLTIFYWAMFLISYFFIKREFFFSRFVLLFASISLIFFIPSFRYFLSILTEFLFSKFLDKRKVLILGYSKKSYEIFLELEKDTRFLPIGTITDLKKNNKFKRMKIIAKESNEETLKKILNDFKISEIFDTKQSRKNDKIISFARNFNIKYRFVPGFEEIQKTNISMENFADFPIMLINQTPLEGWNRVSKRIFDIIFAILAFIALSPLFLFIAILIKLDSRGPIFFSKLSDNKSVLRVGKNKKLFKFYKFRTMEHNSDKYLKSLIKKQNAREDGPLYKIKNDPRITRIGKYLRMSSIDELPQLFSVLMGDLSIVGPRPHTPIEVAKYKNFHKRVFEIKPGITGLSQVSGRHRLSFADENRLDIFYIENWSFFLDIKIIIKTFFVVLDDIIQKKEN